MLGLADWDREELLQVLDTAASLKEVLRRDIKKVPALRGRAVLLLFFEPSTRTRHSFELACKYMSAEVASLAAATSSVAKGESLRDTAVTCERLGADAIVVRHRAAGAPALLARHVTASVINAGDGMHEHPTQGLLDLLTIRERKGGWAGLRVAVVGDILHSRVARSDLWGLLTLGARVVLCGPPTLLPPGLRHPGRAAGDGQGAVAGGPRPSMRSGDGFPAAGSAADSGPADPAGCAAGSAADSPPGAWPPGVTVTADVEEALDGADVVIALRLQAERQEEALLPSVEEYARRWGITRGRLSLARPDVLLMHPGPVHRGVEVADELVDGASSAIAEQVTNGVAVRMALLYLLLGGGGDV